MSEHEAGECRACAVRLRQELQNTAGISSNRSWSRAHVHVCVYRLPYTCCRASDSTHVTERRGCCRRGEELPPRLPAATRASRTLCSAVFRPQAGFSPDFKRQVSAAQTRPPEGCLINRGFRNKVHFSEEKKLVPQVSFMVFCVDFLIIFEEHHTQPCRNRLPQDRNQTCDLIYQGMKEISETESQQVVRTDHTWRHCVWTSS